MLLTGAPNTFRMPISFVRCNTLKADKLNKPKHAMMIARIENNPNTLPNWSSAS